MANIDIFFNAYLACALWSTNDESDERGGEVYLYVENGKIYKG